jgi:hypothetical protein
MPQLTKQEREEFELYLQQCTDIQVHGVIEKESAAGRSQYVKLAKQELERRSQT